LPNDAALAAAKACYEANYWTPLLLDQVQDQGVAGKVLDIAVNMGTGEAPFLFQRAINASGGKLTVDGKIGPLTIEAANAASGVLVLNALRSLACQFYRDLAARKPEDAQYLDGWLARARS
jgi:lysozyme family protein